jgi:hypothetical protein
METVPGGLDLDPGMDAFLSGISPEVFTNANAITKWLLNQPEESRLG